MADKTMMLAPLGKHRGLCCGGSPLNEICTLFGFYCRFLAYLLACALALSTAFHAPGSQIMAPSGLVAYGACAAAAMVLLESSWICFHNRCLMTRATLLCDSYLVRAVLYAALSAGGVLRCVYARAAPDLLALYIALGGLALFFAVAHWERPPSIYKLYLDEKTRKEAREKMLEDEKRAGGDSGGTLLSGDAV